MLFKSIVPVLALSSVIAAYDSFRLQSWNIRYDSIKDGIALKDTLSSLDDSIPSDGGPYYSDYKEESWSKRRIGVAQDVIFNKADIFTVNEALKNQVDDLKTLLGELGGGSWDYIGVGREDGAAKGEIQAIFYNQQKFFKKSNYTIWLSDTPFEPSIYPGTHNYRSTTVGHFETKSGNKFTLINTHFDHESEDHRKLSASLLRQLGAHEYHFGDGPVFMVGDFNSQAEGSTSGGYKTAVGAEDPVSINGTFAKRFSAPNSHNFIFSDLLAEAEPAQRSGHHSTFSGFKPITDKDAVGDRIDFQMVGKFEGDSNQRYHNVERIRVAEVFYDLGFKLSDHRPVISDISIEK